eukprot:6150938-Amphidinium_carterae.1
MMLCCALVFCQLQFWRESLGNDYMCTVKVPSMSMQTQPMRSSLLVQDAFKPQAVSQVTARKAYCVAIDVICQRDTKEVVLALSLHGSHLQPLPCRASITWDESCPVLMDASITSAQMLSDCSFSHRCMWLLGSSSLQVKGSEQCIKGMIEKSHSTFVLHLFA